MRNSFQPIIELIQLHETLSEPLTRCHNLIAHFVPIDNFDHETQNDLFALYGLIEELRKIEKDILDSKIG